MAQVIPNHQTPDAFVPFDVDIPEHPVVEDERIRVTAECAHLIRDVIGHHQVACTGAFEIQFQSYRLVGCSLHCVSGREGDWIDWTGESRTM